jgi:hypothetical protein
MIIMLKNMLNVSGAKELNKVQLKNTTGGAISSGGGWSCIRTKNGVSHTFFGNQSSGSATAWVNAWGSMGWDAHCGHQAEQ